MLRVRGSTSTNTGRAPTATITFAVATHVIGDVMTSSPGPMPARRSATSMVAVPLASARTGRPPKSRDSCDSNSSTFGPDVIHPDSSTEPTAAIVAASMCGCANGSRTGFAISISAARDDDDAPDVLIDDEQGRVAGAQLVEGGVRHHRERVRTFAPSRQEGGDRGDPFLGLAFGAELELAR